VGRRTLREGGALLLAHFLGPAASPQLTLHKLDLAANLLCFRGNTRGLQAVCAALPLHPSLTELDLSANDIACGGVGSSSSRDGVQVGCNIGALLFYCDDIASPA
jgi:hypothetical protein